MRTPTCSYRDSVSPWAHTTLWSFFVVKIQEMVHLLHRCGIFQIYTFCYNAAASAHVAQPVEHVLGKDEVTGANPVVGSSCML